MTARELAERIYTQAVAKHIADGLYMSDLSYVENQAENMAVTSLITARVFTRTAAKSGGNDSVDAYPTL